MTKSPKQLNNEYKPHYTAVPLSVSISNLKYSIQAHKEAIQYWSMPNHTNRRLVHRHIVPTEAKDLIRLNKNRLIRAERHLKILESGIKISNFELINIQLINKVKI